MLSLCRAIHRMSSVNINPLFVFQVDGVISRADVIRAYNLAAASMHQLNRNAARLMHEFSAHACTDVTGFGILGHASNLAKAQKAEVDIVITRLPVIAGMVEVDQVMTGGSLFKVSLWVPLTRACVVFFFFSLMFSFCGRDVEPV